MEWIIELITSYDISIFNYSKIRNTFDCVLSALPLQSTTFSEFLTIIILRYGIVPKDNFLYTCFIFLTKISILWLLLPSFFWKVIRSIMAYIICTVTKYIDPYFLDINWQYFWKNSDVKNWISHIHLYLVRHIRTIQCYVILYYYNQHYFINILY